MITLTLVTSNPNKLKELESLFPATWKLSAKKLDLDEIQTLDIHKIVRQKLKQAYKKVKGPVLVEDVSAEHENLNGLPGPFIKYFEQALGQDSLYIVGGEGKAVLTCTMGYYDGKEEFIADGIVNGTIVPPRQGEGWGFDYVFMPDGYIKTYSELGPDFKNQISHRYRAAIQMANFLKKL